MNYPTEWEKEFTTKKGLKIVFRPEKPDDTEMLWVMFSTLSKKSASYLLPPFSRERIESWTSEIDYDEVLAIVAVLQEKDNKRIIGTTSLRFNSQKPLKHNAELGLTIHDDYQNMGIGSALLKHIIKVARTKKLKKIHLNVSATNKRAIHLYKKAGFTTEGILQRESYVNGRYRDEYRMAHFL
ncbi:MAG: GNAT family N-acetyltransferase [Candidatus Bathyarchaeota archaeon]|nr:GNAT family N-acetyltransferase [Candidatus Bathyarchaeota archaeon]